MCSSDLCPGRTGKALPGRRGQNGRSSVGRDWHGGCIRLPRHPGNRAVGPRARFSERSLTYEADSARTSAVRSEPRKGGRPTRAPGRAEPRKRSGTSGPEGDLRKEETGRSTGSIGQAQGSTGRVRLETDEQATDPTMEQGLEVPAPRVGGGDPTGTMGNHLPSQRKIGRAHV